jgi:hypothetical protein
MVISGEGRIRAKLAGEQTAGEGDAGEDADLP